MRTTNRLLLLHNFRILGVPITLPRILNWLLKPDLATAEKLQEALSFKYMNKG